MFYIDLLYLYLLKSNTETIQVAEGQKYFRRESHAFSGQHVGQP